MAEISTGVTTHCPSCQSKAKRVSVTTIEALLKPEFVGEIAANTAEDCCSSDSPKGCSTVKGDTGWRFCESKGCDVVYFSGTDAKTFTRSQLSVPVGAKEESGDRPLCYCFEYSVQSIKDDLRNDGKTHALSDIRARMKDPGCSCGVKNPSGNCCLGSVAKGIKIAEEELKRE